MTTQARLVLLAGPSGSGKTHLAEESGLPLLDLDDPCSWDAVVAPTLNCDVRRVKWRHPLVGCHI